MDGHVGGGERGQEGQVVGGGIEAVAGESTEVQTNVDGVANSDGNVAGNAGEVAGRAGEG